MKTVNLEDFLKRLCPIPIPNPVRGHLDGGMDVVVAVNFVNSLRNLPKNLPPAPVRIHGLGLDGHMLYSYSVGGVVSSYRIPRNYCIGRIIGVHPRGRLVSEIGHLETTDFFAGNP